MAEAVVKVLIDNLTSFLKGEIALLFGFENEFQRLSSMFSTIQAVLEDAQEKQLNDKPLENWLQKLNVATYEVDDILDEYKTKATRFSQSAYGCYHPKVIPFRHKVGKRMDQVMKKLHAIAEERKNFHLHEKIIERQVVKRETGSVLTEPQVYGRDKEKDEIVKILINNVSDAQELSVLPIVGMGGLGKTTLAQMVFNDQTVTEHLYPKIWICVSNDFDEKRLIKAIIESIEGKSLSDMDLAPLQKKLQELLNGKRYLLVLDDVWNEDQQKWANLRAVLKVGASGASVLTTTRLEKVGSIMGTLQPYELSNLSQEDCWLLLMQRAFGYQEEINPNLVAIGMEIVKKCGGVPLAAKTLGASTSGSNIREINVKGYYSHKMSIGFAKVVSSYSPSLLKRFVSLRVLNLSNLKLGQLPSSIGDLVHLRYLNLSSNSMRSLPKQLCKLQNLQTLDLQDCLPLRCLPKQTSKLVSLRNLLLDHNLLKSMPPRIGSLTCLKTLGQFIVGRKKESLQLWWGSEDVEYVEEVDIDVDSGFPTRIRFPSLRKLVKWDFGNLKGLLKKEGEEQFPVLEEMKIHGCPMFVIPTLSSVKKLKVLGDKSDATVLRSICNLRALTYLYISINYEAASLPEEMFKSLANLFL
uniref:Disease resistance protein RGA2 n=1 Tax=Solanum tuberosum TaxID=4113 RepID=M1D1N4_SOLTU